MIGAFTVRITLYYSLCISGEDFSGTVSRWQQVIYEWVTELFIQMNQHWLIHKTSDCLNESLKSLTHLIHSKTQNHLGIKLALFIKKTDSQNTGKHL